jgi:uncharacterized protein YndB with AHSA1/START domain
MNTPARDMTNYSLSIGRRVRAPLAAVFDAWLNADLLRAWMKPRPEVVLTDVRTNATIGGTFRIVMRAYDKDELHEGAYCIIDRPNMLSFSRTSVPAGADTGVDISFLKTTDDQTMVLLKHERLCSPIAAENHREGWRRILDSLARTLESEQGALTP